MQKLTDMLATSPSLSRVPLPALRASAPLWSLRELLGGEVYCREGAPGDTIALVVQGGCSARVDGVEVGKVGPGEVVGEVAAFFPGARRSATLVSAGPSSLLVLPAAALPRLRAESSPLYRALLDRALLEVARRVQRSTDLLAHRVEGSFERPVRKDPGALGRLLGALRPGRPTRPGPPLAPLLQGLPRLRSADGAVLARLEGAFEARAFDAGEVLVLEQEPGDAAWLVAEGQVDVLRQVRGTRAVRLARLTPGSLFGVNALVLRGPRTASCVAATPGWAWRLRAEAADALDGDARVWWGECVLAAMQAQLRLVDGSLASVLSPTSRPRGSLVPRARMSITPRSRLSIAPQPGQFARARPAVPRPRASVVPRGSAEREMDALLRQAGMLEGLPGVDMEDIRLVVDEDTRRARVPRRG